MMKIVHNSRYFIWFELGRLAVVDDVLEHAPAWRERVMTPVVMNQCHYLAPARVGDELIVTTKHTIADAWTGRLSFHHSISNRKNKAELATGSSEITLVDTRTFKTVKEFPPTLWKSYQNLR